MRFSYRSPVPGNFVPTKIFTLVFPVVLTVVSSASAQPSSLRAASRPVVLFIHGRGFGGLPEDSVRTAWLGAFEEGQKSIGFAGLRTDQDVRLVWYGSSSMHYNCRTQLSALNTDRRSILQRIAEIVARLPGVEQRIGEAVFQDTQAYFSDGCYRGQVDNELREELERAKIEKRPIVLVAHSMGSLVALSVLTQEWVPTEDESVALITIGSMLGMEEMPKALLGSYVESPVPVPQVVTHWMNVRNDGDLLSFSTVGRFRSRVQARIPVDVPIKARGASRHSAETYLRDPAFANIVADSWCDAFPLISDRPSECSRARR